MTRTITARAGALTLLVLIGLQAGVGPALADPAVPTHYRSTVTEVVDADGEPIDLDVEVLGGDTYLVVEVPAGTELGVPGYDGEPYIRVHADGEVEVNQRSPARWLNDARYGSADVDVPALADAHAPPDWELVARDGVYAWHDHRIHFMSPALPAQVDPSSDEVQEIWDWEVPITVDGEEAVILGELVWVPGTGVALPALALVVAIALGVVVARRIGGDPLVLLAAATTLVLAAANNLGLPPGADRYPALWVLPAVAVGVLAAGRWRSRTDQVGGPLLRALAAVPPAVGAMLLIGALTRPIVPGLLPTAATRTLVVAILAASVASLVPQLTQVWAASSLDTGPADGTETGTEADAAHEPVRREATTDTDGR